MVSLSCKMFCPSGMLKLDFASKVLSESYIFFKGFTNIINNTFLSKIVVPNKINVIYFSRNIHFHFHINLCIFQVKSISYFTILKNIFDETNLMKTPPSVIFL